MWIILDKGKKNTTLIVVTIAIVAPIILLLIISSIIELTRKKTEVRDIYLAIPYGFERTSAKINSPDENSLPYYISIEVSIGEFYRNESSSGDDMRSPSLPISDEIIRFESDDYLLVIFATEPRKNVHSMQSFIFRKNDGKFSYPIYMWDQEIKGHWTHPGIYYEEDRVARDIIKSYANEFTARVNNGSILYYGAGLDDKLQNLVILDYTPTKVIPFEYKRNTYYFWYFLGELPFTEVLEINNLVEKTSGDIFYGETVGFYHFKTGEIIECFEIAFSDE